MDLLRQQIHDENIDVVIASDHHGLIDGVGGWMVAGKSALGVFGDRISVSGIERDTSFVAAKINSIVVYSCYISPNTNMQQYEDSLHRLEGSIRRRGFGNDIIVAGDFNARSAAWGDWLTNSRGEALYDLFSSVNLTVLNKGSVPTFVGIGRGSVVDVTAASSSMLRKLSDWRVRVDIDNWSDHNYVSFVVQDGKRNEANHFPNVVGWDSAGLDIEIFRTGYLWSGHGLRDQDTSLEFMLDVFESKVHAACNLALPKRKLPPHGKPPAYWWSGVIAELRRVCIHSRRAATRAGSDFLRGKASMEELDRLKEDLKQARKKLKLAIRDSKRKCWQELIKMIDKDPWGRPYRLVMGKLKGGLETQRMDCALIKETARELFPDHSAMLPVPLAVPSQFEVRPFSAEEVDE
ncbi:uncharacterized protein LOC126909193, partial [Daktulosphaira vitifoliae]|uniref:uncharacterized protein LOC126909193 n=1 Tax=Daktulosphaira vitifoliae TaxID=58002 RepID=UPI0021AAE85D